MKQSAMHLQKVYVKVLGVVMLAILLTSPGFSETRSLSRGLNLLGVPIDTSTVSSAQDLLTLLGNKEQIKSISRLNSTTGIFETVGYDADGNIAGADFPVNPGDAWMVHALSDTSFDYSKSTVCPHTELKQGVNLLNFPCASEGLTAYALLESLGGASVVASIQGYDPSDGSFYTAGYADGALAGPDFPILPDQGYFVFNHREPPEFGLDITVSPLSGSAPLEMQFSNQITGGYPLTYEWDIDGDGTVDDTRPGFRHIYTQSGTYTAVLLVKDIIGRSFTATKTILVHPEFTVIATAAPERGPSPLTVSFSATIHKTGANMTLYEWDFNGDGIIDYSDRESADVSHTYTDLGFMTATLHVTDASGISQSDSINISVGSSPQAAASITPENGAAPLPVDFSGTGTDMDGHITLYEWDFDGDGVYDWTSTTMGNLSHLYNLPGIYVATLRVTDNDGLVDTASVLVTISGPPISRPGCFPATGQAPLTVTFFSDAEDVDGSPEYYDWDFDGDGTIDERLTASMNTTYTYSEAGTYNAALTIIDNEGLSNTRYVTITVSEPPTAAGEPTAIAMATPANGGAPLSVFLSGSGSDEDGTIARLEWDFEGDGVFDFEDIVVSGGTLGNITDFGTHSSPDFADIDNDGDLDMLAGESSGQIWLFRNDGDIHVPVWVSVGYLTDITESTVDVGTYSRPDFVDIDNDGDLDMLVGESGGRIWFYRNDGDSSTPVWTSVEYLTDSAGSTIDVGSEASPDFVDIDNDGDFDLIAGGTDGSLWFYRNDGDSGVPAWIFVSYLTDSEGSIIDVGSRSNPDFMDIDNDGALDMLVGEYGGVIWFYRNNGDSSTPVWTLVGNLPDFSGTTIDVGFYASPGFVDMDGDGDLDLLLGENNGRIQYYLNVGDAQNPVFKFASYLGYIGVDSYSVPCFIDFDNDGDQDMVIGDHNGLLFYYRNDGNNTSPLFNPMGALTDSSGNTVDVGLYSSPDFVDIDNDGDLDMLVGESGGRIWFYRNEGDSSTPVWASVGYLTDSEGSTLDVGTHSTPDFVDIDNDGDLDMLTGEQGGRIGLYRNEGDSSTPVWTSAGYLTDSSGSIIDGGSNSRPDFVDTDHDGDVDMLVGDYGGQIWMYRNNGTADLPVWDAEGNLADAAGNIIDMGLHSTPQFVDIDNDGDFDILSGNSSGFVYLYPTLGAVNHTYTLPGTYGAVLRVTDNNGRTATDSVTIAVLDDGAPSSRADATPTTGDVPLMVTFKGQGKDGDGTIVLYEWDFDGDGTYDWNSESSGQTSFTYNQAGTYPAKLRITDNDGKTSTDIIEISTRLHISASGTGSFDPVSGATASITSVLSGDTIMTVDIVTPDGNIVQTIVDSQSRPSGTYMDVWDGKDANGSIVRDGIYYFLIKHTNHGETQLFDLREVAQYEAVVPNNTWPSIFNPFEEDYVSVTYETAFPAEVSMYFWRRDTSRPESEIAPVRTLFLRQPKDAGSHTEIWDGVDDNGVFVEPWTAGYPVTLWVYELPANAIIVTGNTPVLMDIDANPNFFNPSYNPYRNTEPRFSTISFSLSKPADLDVRIKNSNGVVIDSFTRTDLPAGSNTIVWDGKDYEDKLVKEGRYSISLTAIDPYGNRSLPRYAAIIIQY